MLKKLMSNLQCYVARYSDYVESLAEATVHLFSRAFGIAACFI
ncbi:hypothetical protein C357_06187 [Citreicella sp. 357]|nr:hypothetical protein C357_06187 [Citreicella sp. 357]